MKNILTFTVIFMLFATQSFAQIPAGYYDSAAGLTGESLREQLRSIITAGHTSNNYGDLYGYYLTTDNFGNNKVWDMYSIRCDGTADYWYYFNSGQECGTYAVEGDCYNREHSVPQSWFGSASPMVADLFIVYPTDGKVNGWRSNYPYGETASPSTTTSNGSKVGSCSYPGYTGTIFEPIDCYKGDFARTYFYVATRYKNEVGSWTGNATVVFSVDNLSDFARNLFLEWNALDPVDQKEIDRNNAVYNIQGNRNPYIDHPEWVECVWNNNCAGTISFTSTPVTTALTNQTYTYDITYTVVDETETITCPTKPAWLSFSGNTTNNTAVLTGSPADTDIGFHNVVIELTENGTTVTQSFTIEVGSNLTVDIINEDFTTCPANGWTIFSTAGSKDWICGTNSDMYVNAYGGDVASDDWLISPVINFNDYTNEVLTFDTWTRYADTGVTDPEVRLYYSTDYSGSGDPSAATWTELTYTFPAEDSQVWTSSGSIDLSGINGTAGYIAFHYTSSGVGAGTSAWWELDNVLLRGDQSSGTTNTLPEFTSTPVTSVTAGDAYTYNITASDTDGDALVFSALTKPAWLTLNDNGDGTATLSGTPSNSDAGDNSVILSVSDGTGSANQEFVITVTAVGSVSYENKEINIYPNPAKNTVTISFSDKIKSISLKNILGKTVFAENDINVNSYGLDINKLPEGVYFIEIISSGNRKFLKKLIKD